MQWRATLAMTCMCFLKKARSEFTYCIRLTRIAVTLTGGGTGPYIWANLVVLVNEGSVTALMTFHWLTFVWCSVYKKPKAKFIRSCNQNEHNTK